MTRSTRPSGTNKRAAAVPAPRRSPVLLLTAGAIAVGLVLVAVLATAANLPGGGTAAIATPVSRTLGALVDGRTVGAADAPVTIDVWADFQCPVCGRFAEDIEPLLVARYVEPGLVRMTFHDFGFIGPESFDAAVAARVAGALADAFWAYHDLLFANQDGENQGAFSRARLTNMAVAVGLDRRSFLTAMDDPSYLDAVRQETASGLSLGIHSTPTMVINGQQAAGLPDWGRLAAYLDGLLADAGGAPAVIGAPAASGDPAVSGDPTGSAAP